MSFTSVLTPPAQSSIQPILYPESDGKPMADNSKQFRYIVTIEGNSEILFEDNPDVFIAGDMLWYPVEGHPEICQAPDVMIVFGRPKGDRGSYLQWQEENIPPQVVFEVLSPSNRKREMDDKFAFYERYGVEEYYLYDPHRGRLRGWLRDGQGHLHPITPMNGWHSLRLGVRFETIKTELQLYYPNGEQFLTFLELNQRRRIAEARALEANEYALEVSEQVMETEERIQQEIQVRTEAEAKAVAEAAARAAAEAKAAAEAQARTAAETRIRELEAKLRAAGLSTTE